MLRLKDNQIPSKPIFAIIALTAVLLISGAFLYYLFTSKQVQKEIQRLDQPKLVFAQKPAVSENFNPDPQSEPYACPIDRLFCKDQANFKNKMFQIKLTRGNNIYASFDGSAEVLASFTPAGEEYRTIIITNSDLGLIAYYYFTGESLKDGKVTKGEVLAKTDNPVKIFDDNSFAFQLIQLDQNSGTAVDLNPKEFK